MFGPVLTLDLFNSVLIVVGPVVSTLRRVKLIMKKRTEIVKEKTEKTLTVLRRSVRLSKMDISQPSDSRCSSLILLIIISRQPNTE